MTTQNVIVDLLNKEDTGASHERLHSLTGDIADSCIAYSKEISMMATRKTSIGAPRGTVLNNVAQLKWYG